MRALVIGGGIGGLSAAIALANAGIEPAVFEQLEQVGTTLVGGGFHLWPNSTGPLTELGLGEAVRELGAPLQRTEFCSWKRGRIAEWPIDEIARSVGAFDIGIPRHDLMGLLHASFDGEVVPDAKLVDFVQDAEGVTARFADGREERGDVLVGADGLRSVVRAQLLGAAEPDYAGYVQWQTLIDEAEELFPAGIERITFGPGTRAVMHRVSGGRLFWACVIYGPAERGGKAPGRKQRLLDTFDDWPDPIPAAVRATPEDAIIGLPVYDRKPVSSWGTGRVTLLGDAAHPMTTNTSQGGNLAIEDGFVLARCLAGGEAPEAALRGYEQRRIARTTPLVKNSRWISDMNAWRSPLRVAFRDRFFRVGVPRKGLGDLRKAMAVVP